MTARAAARAVAGYALDAADARLLLDMLGLLDEDGQLVEDDPAEQSGHGRVGHDVVLHERAGTTSTAPAGLTALIASTTIREAAASVALDGETHVFEDFDLVSVSLPDQEPADDNSGAPVRRRSKNAAGMADPVGDHVPHRPAPAHPEPAPPRGPVFEVHGDQPAEYSVTGITVDVGEVVHPHPAPDQQEDHQVDDTTPSSTGVVHRRDLLAEGLAHRDPAVVAVAQRALRDIDQLAELLLRRGPRR